MSEITKLEQNLSIKKIDNETINISINNAPNIVFIFSTIILVKLFFFILKLLQMLPHIFFRPKEIVKILFFRA